MTITVGTFNTRHGRPRRGPARLDLLVRQCAALDAGVLGLQEVDRRVIRSYLADQPRRVAQHIGMQHVWAPARRPIVVGHEGNALLVRGVVRETSILELPHSPAHYQRNAVLARLAIEDAELSIAVTHLHNHAPTAARQLPVVLDRLEHLPEPRVLLGDLNMDRPQAAPLLIDAGYEVADAGPTVPSEAPIRQIDFVAVRGLEIVAAAVHPPLVSDHRPHTAELHIG